MLKVYQKGDLLGNYTQFWFLTLANQAIFCNTSNQGDVAIPLVNLKNKRLRYAYLVPWYSYGSPLSIHTTKVQTYMYDVTITSLLSILPKLPIYLVKYRPKLNFFAVKFHMLEFHRVFLLIKEGNDVSKIYCKIQDHAITVKIFFKIVISNIDRLHPPPPSDFDGLPYPRVRCPTICI